MARAISVRLDDEADKALRALEASGMTHSSAGRTDRPVDSWRHGALVGHLTAEGLWGVDDALLTVLGLH